MGLFRASHGGTHLSEIHHTSYIDETWYSYTLPKEDPKIHKSQDTHLDFC